MINIIVVYFKFYGRVVFMVFMYGMKNNVIVSIVLCGMIIFIG